MNTTMLPVTQVRPGDLVVLHSWRYQATATVTKVTHDQDGVYTLHTDNTLVPEMYRWDNENVEVVD